MSNLPNIEMQNLGLGGFLIKKTIQNYPLRSPGKDYAQYSDTNMPLYLNKAFKEIRKNLGIDKIPNHQLQEVCLRIKNKAIEKEQVKHIPVINQKKGNSSTNTKQEQTNENLVQNYMKTNKVKEDSDKNLSDKYKKALIQLSPEQKIIDIISQKLNEEQLRNLQDVYEKRKIAKQIEEIKKELDPVTKKLSKKHLVQLRNLTKKSIISPTELVEILQLIPEEQKITLADILEIDENLIVKDQKNEVDMLYGKQSKTLIRMDYDRLAAKENALEQKQLVEIYSETKLDNFDEFIIKKKAQQQTEMYKEMKNQFKQFVFEELRKKNYKEPQRFIRPPEKERKNIRCYSSKKFNRLHSQRLQKSQVPIDTLTKSVWLIERTDSQEYRYQKQVQKQKELINFNKSLDYYKMNNNSVYQQKNLILNSFNSRFHSPNNNNNHKYLASPYYVQSKLLESSKDSSDQSKSRLKFYEEQDQFNNQFNNLLQQCDSLKRSTSTETPFQKKLTSLKNQSQKFKGMKRSAQFKIIKNDSNLKEQVEFKKNVIDILLNKVNKKELFDKYAKQVEARARIAKELATLPTEDNQHYERININQNNFKQIHDNFIEQQLKKSEIFSEL